MYTIINTFLYNILNLFQLDGLINLLNQVLHFLLSLHGSRASHFSIHDWSIELTQNTVLLNYITFMRPTDT